MILISILYVIIMYILASFAEIYLDKFIAPVIDKDNIRTKEENDIIHKRQLPLRGIMYINILVSGLLIYSKNIYWILSFTSFTLMYYWLCIDTISAKWWLKKKWTYRGTTSKTDQISNVVVKQIIGLVISIILCIIVYIN